MTTVGVLEAETGIASLLQRVERGEEIVITRHGKPIARLVPTKTVGVERGDDVIERIKVVRARASLDRLEWRGLRDEGRR